MKAPLLAAEKLRKTYPSGSRTLEVLDGCEFAVEPGELVAIVGPSGVGKSTLLHLLAGLDRPDSGRILYRGRDLASMREVELAAFRNTEVGMVFQAYHLLAEFTALENVMMPQLIAGEPETAARRGAALLEETGLGERGHHYPSELSGGERQRVAIARSLVADPGIVLADEPTGNLDQETGERVMSVFLDLHRQHRTALVMVTHDPDLATGFDRVLTMGPRGRLRVVGDGEGGGA